MRSFAKEKTNSDSGVTSEQFVSPWLVNDETKSVAEKPPLTPTSLGHTGENTVGGQAIKEEADDAVEPAQPKLAELFLSSIDEKEAFDDHLLEKSGIAPEQIESNPHIQQLASERFGRIVRGEICSTLDQTYPLTVPQAIDSPYFVDTLGQIVADETKREQLTDNLDIQRYGERSIESTEFIVSTSVPKEMVGKYRNKVSELAYRETILSMSKYIGALKRLGYQPFRTDESLDQLNHRRLGKLGNYLIQQNAQKLGLLDQSTIDRLYDRRYDKLLAWAERGDASEQMPTCMILPSLRPSSENTTANYWLE